MDLPEFIWSVGEEASGPWSRTRAAVATQIRQNNKSLAETTSAAINASYASINSRISSDEQFAELFLLCLECERRLQAVGSRGRSSRWRPRPFP